MYMKPVTLSVGNDFKSYSHLAHIIDQKDTMKSIYKIRDAWKLANKLVPYKDFSKWLNEPHYDFTLSEEVVDLYLSGKDKVLSLENKKLSEQDVDDMIFTKKFANLNPIDFEIEYLLLKSGLSASYKTILLKAIVCNKVTRKDLPATQSSYEYDLFLKNAQLAFTLWQKQTNKKVRIMLRDKKMEMLPIYRQWYWAYEKERVNGRGIYGRIYAKSDQKYAVNYLQRGVKIYKKFLNTTIQLRKDK